MSYGNYYPEQPLYEINKADIPDAIKHRIDSIISQSEFVTRENINNNINAAWNTRQGRASMCRRVWQNTSESRNYDYLYDKLDKQWEDPETGETRVIQLVSPNEVRHIPIVRPMLQSLISRALERPLRPSCYTVSEEAAQAKLNQHIEAIKEAENKKLLQRIMGVQFYMRGIQAQQQLLQQIQQAQQQAAQTGQPVDPRMTEMIPQLQATIEQAQMMMDAAVLLNEEEKEKIKNYFQYSYRDVVEQAIEQLLVNYIERNAIQQKSVEIFEEKMISDEPIVHIWWEDGMRQPIFELYRPEQVHYPIMEADRNTKQLDYVCIYDPISYGEVVEQYGDRMTDYELADIRQGLPFTSSEGEHTQILPDGRVSFYDMEHRYDHVSVDRYKVFWKEQEKVKAVERENQYGEKWYEIVKDDYKPKKGEKVTTRIRTCLYRGVRIGSRGYYYPIYGKSTWQPRPLDRPSDVFLPFIGKAASRYYKPHSLVFETRDIQELFNILHFQEEQAIILAGLRGIVYDISQRPEGMSMEEIIYYMRRGLMIIQTVSENGTRKNSTFNQFQTFDQSLAPSIGVITQVKSSLLDLVRMITGVTPQQQGQVVQTDQVGTYKMGLAMSTAAVEIYFQQHEWQLEQAMEMLASAIMESNSNGNGTIKVYPDGVRQRIVALPAGVKDEVQVKVNSGRRTQKNLERAEMAMSQALQSGMINLSQYLQLSDMQSLSEMQVAIKDFEEKARAITEAQGQQQQQMAAQMAQQAMQMKAQFDAQLEQVKGQMKERLEQIKGQIDMQKAQVETQVKQAELAISQQVAQMDDATKRYGIDADNYIETQYLDLQRQQLGIEERGKDLDRALKSFESRIKANNDIQKQARTGNKIRD